MGLSLVRLDIVGMHCASCSQLIEKMVSKIPGVESAVVNLANNTATVNFAPERCSLDDILQKISSLGFSATPIPEKRKQFDEQRRERERLQARHDRQLFILFTLLRDGGGR